MLKKGDIAERLAALSPAKRALLEKRLKADPKDLSSMGSIPRRHGQDSPPLSFSQERIWFLDRFAPRSRIYNRSASPRLTGPLKVTALERSLNEIVRRHAILRTTFPLQGEGPRQVVAPSLKMGFPLTDLRNKPKAEREKELQKLVSKVARRPFDLAADPLLRGNLYRLDDLEHVLLLSMHHIVFDGWSEEVL